MKREYTPSETRDFIRKNVALEDRGHSSLCWIWPLSIGANGYGNSRRLGQFGAHRVSYVAFKGPIEPGMCVCHACDVPTCVNPEHLWKGSRHENMRDKAAKGRARGGGQSKRGSDSHWARLTEDQVLAIRASKEKARVTAQQYGVAVGTIARIRARATWKHI